VIVLVAIILLGPERMPVVARALARAYKEFTKVRAHVDTTISELKQEMQLDLDLDAPPVRPPAGRRVPLDQLHAADDVLAPTHAEPSGLDALPVLQEDDYLAS